MSLVNKTGGKKMTNNAGIISEHEQEVRGMRKYALCVVMYEGDKFPPARFIFESNDQEEAEKLAYKWAIYQGLNYRLDVIVRLANQNELIMNVHNEYIYSDSRK